MKQALDILAQEQLFTQARTRSRFDGRPLTDETIQALYALLRWGPTSMNTQPARFVFVRGAAAKERLCAVLSPGNVDKTRAAPATVIVAHDSRFYDQLPSQFPAAPAAREMFVGNAPLSASTAFRNGTLQGAYLILAARTLGLDAGPMSGFDNAKLDAAFFADAEDTRFWQSNFLVNLGWAEEPAEFARGPRLPFEQAVRVL